MTPHDPLVARRGVVVGSDPPAIGHHVSWGSRNENRPTCSAADDRRSASILRYNERRDASDPRGVSTGCSSASGGNGSHGRAAPTVGHPCGGDVVHGIGARDPSRRPGSTRESNGTRILEAELVALEQERIRSLTPKRTASPRTATRRTTTRPLIAGPSSPHFSGRFRPTTRSSCGATTSSQSLRRPSPPKSASRRRPADGSTGRSSRCDDARRSRRRTRAR